MGQDACVDGDTSMPRARSCSPDVPSANLAASSTVLLRRICTTSYRGVNGLDGAREPADLPSRRATTPGDDSSGESQTVSPADKSVRGSAEREYRVCVFSGPIDPIKHDRGARPTISGRRPDSRCLPRSASGRTRTRRRRLHPRVPLPASTAMTLTVSGVTDAGRQHGPHPHQRTSPPARRRPVLSSLRYAIADQSRRYQTTGCSAERGDQSCEANGAIDATTVNSGTF